jgi:hypothetical protein
MIPSVNSHLMDAIPIPLLFVITVALTLAAIELGFRLGGARRRRSEEPPGPTGTAVGAILGLLAFILAFTFGMASNRYQARKQLVLQDANAMGTCYLRADFLPTPEERTATRKLLAEYIGVMARLDPKTDTQEEIQAAIERCQALHTELWAAAVAAGQAKPSPLTALFAASCNEVFDVFDERLTLGTSRIPSPVWLLLFAIALFSMLAMGYHAGLVSDQRAVGPVFLVVVFATVIVLIADLDNGLAGALRIDQRPVIALNASIGG